MSKRFKILVVLAIIFQSAAAQKHLIILSGQSNMVGMQPSVSFEPILVQRYGKGNVVIVKSAQGAQSIRRWDKNWKKPTTDLDNADLFDSLSNKIKPFLPADNFDDVTFIWMQGERDARLGNADVYEGALMRLYQQVSKFIGRTDLNMIVGRLSDYGNNSGVYPDWMKIREIQERLGKSGPRFSWIDTDDLNTGLNSTGKAVKDDLHMSVAGYAEMGRRFAEETVKLISVNKK